MWQEYLKHSERYPEDPAEKFFEGKLVKCVYNDHSFRIAGIDKKLNVMSEFPHP